MNPNSDPYPRGRWTPVLPAVTPAPEPAPVPSAEERIPNRFLDFDLSRARLSELFWTPPESELFLEAVERLDSFLQLAADMMTAEPAPAAVHAGLSAPGDAHAA